MKRLIIITMILIGASVNSQVCIGKADYFNENSKKNKPEEIESFKKSKTIFVFPNCYSKEQYNSILSDVWKVTNYEVVYVDEYKNNKDKYIQVGNSIAEFFNYINTITYTRQSGSSRSVDYIFVKLELRYLQGVKEGKKGKKIWDSSFLSTVFFTPSIDLRDHTFEMNKENMNKVLNFKLGYLKNYLQSFNDKLSLNENFNCFDDFSIKEKVKELQTKKLFVSEDIKAKYNAFSMTEGEEREEGELLKDYKYDYELTSDENINQKIVNGDDFYYLMYSQVNSKKILSIVNAKTGEIIYNTQNRTSYNIKAKDFKQISKAISKT